MQAGDFIVINKVRTSNLQQGFEGRISASTDLSVGPLMGLIPERYQKHLLKGIPDDIVQHIVSIDSISTDTQIYDVSILCGEEPLQLAMMDVLLSLKSGDVVNAKNVIDKFKGNATPVVNLLPTDVALIQSSESVVLVSDVDPELFKHFVETASFEQWMLYLHPSQREHVAKDFAGSARLAGGHVKAVWAGRPRGRTGRGGAKRQRAGARDQRVE